MCLVLSSPVSASVVLVIQHNFCYPHPPPTQSFKIFFVVPVVLPLCHISAAAISISLCFRRYIRCHPYLPPLSSSVSASAFLINLCLPCRSRPSPYPPSCISASAIIIVLLLCRVYSAAVSIIPSLFCCRSPFLHPRYVPNYRSSCTPQPLISGAPLWLVSLLCYDQRDSLAVTVGQQPATVSV